MKSSLDETGLRVKVDHKFGGLGISHEESICNLRERGKVYGRGAGTRICYFLGVQCIFPCLELMM